MIKNVHLFTLYLQKGECAAHEKHLDGFGANSCQSTQENYSSTSLIGYITVISIMHCSVQPAPLPLSICYA